MGCHEDGITGRRCDASGVVFVVATLLSWSSVLLLLAHLTPYIDAWTANGWRYGVSALMWMPVLAMGRRSRTLPAGIWRRAFVPAVVNCAGQACFALTPYYIGPGLAGFLLRVSLVSSTCGAMLLFADERRLLKRGAFWGGMGLIVAGAVGTVLLGEGAIEGATATGILLGVLAGAFFGLYGVSVRYYMRDVPAVTSFSAISFYTAVGMVAMMILLGERGGLAVVDLSALNWIVLVGSAVVGIAVGHVCYYIAMAHLGVAVASAVIQLAPFLGGVGAVWFFGEMLTWGQWLSGGIMLGGGIWLIQSSQRRPPEAVAAREGTLDAMRSDAAASGDAASVGPASNASDAPQSESQGPLRLSATRTGSP